MTKILIIHRNFPAQFRHVATALAQFPNVSVRALTDFENGWHGAIPTVRYVCNTDLNGSHAGLGQSFAAHAARGECAARAMLHMRDSGYSPDIVIGHVGWGETLFVKDVWPTARLIVHAEFYYAAAGADVGFDPEFDERNEPAKRFRVRSLNASILSSLVDADYRIAPTEWQARRMPDEFRGRVQVIHEGIDTRRAAPDAQAEFAVGDTVLRAGDEIVTFVSRNLEPYRGYHVFMRALPEILAARPNAHAVIVGGDQTSYGPAPAPHQGTSWKEVFLAEVRDRLPAERVHFVGQVPYGTFLNILQVSAAHVYLTYPFVLSWSMLEAMSAGALVIGSRTSPVEEVITAGENGLLVDFFDRRALVETVVDCLADPERYRPLREAGRQTIVDRFDLEGLCLPRWIEFLETVI